MRVEDLSEHIEHGCTVADGTGTAPQPDERAADGLGTPPAATGSARIATSVTAETIGTVPQPAKQAADGIGTPAETRVDDRELVLPRIHSSISFHVLSGSPSLWPIPGTSNKRLGPARAVRIRSECAGGVSTS